MASTMLTLNVGGTHFCTTNETVLKEPSSKIALLARGILPSSCDEAGHVFLDRDPKYFQCVLNYLRDGWTLLPASSEERRELLQEARFFQLNGFESWLRTQELLGDKSDAIPKSTAEAPATPASPTTPPSAPATPVKAAESPLRAASTPPRIYTAQPSSPAARYVAPYSPARSIGSTFSSYSPTRSPAATTTVVYHTNHSHCASCCRATCCAVCNPFAKVCVPPPAIDDGYRWTAKYLRTNPKVREVVDTLLELAYMPPHRALSCGRVGVSLESLPEGDVYLSSRALHVRVSGTFGWTFDFTVRPACDYCLYQKYNICEYVQDNWFVLSAILKDQYGVVMEEDPCHRPASILTKRYNLHVTLHKPCC